MNIIFMYFAFNVSLRIKDLIFFYGTTFKISEGISLGFLDAS